jgi:acyl-CoA thioesterase I
VQAQPLYGIRGNVGIMMIAGQLGRLRQRLQALAAALTLGATLAGLLVTSASAGPFSESQCQRARAAAYDGGPQLSSQSIKVIAIGSSSTEGIVRNAREMLYPAAMQSALRARWPQADISVLNKGRGGETMADTLKRFESDVIALKPSLVIWQLGVNDVLRFQGVEGRKAEIRAGLKLLGDHGIPVILLDLQYAPVVLKDPDTLPMLDLIDSAAHEGVNGRVFHFKRFAAMKDLAEKQAVAMSEMTDGDGLHMTDAMHSCVGRLLADMVGGRGSLVASSDQATSFQASSGGPTGGSRKTDTVQ